MRKTLRSIVISVLGAIPATYLGIALYLFFLPGGETLVGSMRAAFIFLVGLAIPASSIAAVVGLVVALTPVSAGRTAFSAIFGISAAMGARVSGDAPNAGDTDAACH